MQKAIHLELLQIIQKTPHLELHQIIQKAPHLELLQIIQKAPHFGTPPNYQENTTFGTTPNHAESTTFHFGAKQMKIIHFSVSLWICAISSFAHIFFSYRGKIVIFKFLNINQ